MEVAMAAKRKTPAKKAVPNVTVSVTKKYTIRPLAVPDYVRTTSGYYRDEPLEYWMNVYPSGPFGSLHLSKDDADKTAHGSRLRCVHLREVTDEKA
jgi:hypothetical protein